MTPEEEVEKLRQKKEIDDRLLNNKEEEDNKNKESIDDEIIKWSEKVREKYNNLHDVVLDNLPDMWMPLEFALSVKTVLNIKGCSLPFAGIILGPPGSLKTAVIQSFRGYRYSYYSDNFTAKAVVTHNAAVKKDKLKDYDMLPKFENRLLLTPELAPIFSSKDEVLLEFLGLMTRLLDGHGYESDTGAQGHRGYNRDIMFTWLGAAVEIPYKVHKHLSTLGPKIYFFRLPRVERNKEDYLYYLQHVSDNFPERLDRIKYALYEYIAYFELHPLIEQDDDGELPKIPFDGVNGNDNNQLMIMKVDEYLINLARLLSHLRTIVPTWHTNDTQGAEYAYTVAIVEEPMRAITQLKNLARAHALSQGRNHITIEDDLPIIIKTVLSTCSIERSTIFDILIANNGKLRTSGICESLNITAPTARRTMTELKAVGLVTMEEGDNNTEAEIELKKPEFEWFLSDEFKELKSQKEKFPPRRRYNPILLLIYYSILNKKINLKSENTFNEDDGARGGSFSFTENNCNGSSHYSCYYCDDFGDSNNAKDYESHVIVKHGLKHQCYPSKIDLETLGLKAQGREWEI